MADELRFDPDDVEFVTKRIRVSTDIFEGKKANLLQKCIQYSGCWGNDEFGNAFAKGYLPSQGTMCDNGDAIVLGLSTFSINLGNGVLALEETDQDNADRL